MHGGMDEKNTLPKHGETDINILRMLGSQNNVLLPCIMTISNIQSV